MNHTLSFIGRTQVRFRGRKLVYFSGCDYFRLARNRAVLRAAAAGVKRFGMGVSASRTTTGNHAVYEHLEAGLARFFGAESALLVSAGYLGPLVAAQALAGDFSHVLMDEKAHAALRDAARFFNCPEMVFKHRDAADFARSVRRCGPGSRPVALTNGMFPSDGSVAPIGEYLKCLPPDATLLLDDAHGAGVLGKSGRGTLEHEGAPRRQVIQCITLSKAFGAGGGAVLGTRELRQAIVERSRAFIGSTPPALPLACAALEALHILRNVRRFHDRLWDNTNYIKNELRRAEIEFADNPGPIIALPPKDKGTTASIGRALLAAGVYPSFIRYPGGPAEGCFRFVISSEHTRGKMRALNRALMGSARTAKSGG